MSRCQAARTCCQDCQRSLGFVCVPVDFKHCASNGFAFINLLSPHQSNFEDVLFSTTRACQDVKVVYAIKRAGTGLDDHVMRYVDAVPQRYNLSMCAFGVLSSCPGDASFQSRREQHLDEKVGNWVLSAGWDTGATLPASTSSTYGRTPGQPSSSSLARRVCVQSPTTSSFLSSSTPSRTP